MASNQPRPSKAQRREAARAKAKELREEEERRARRATITRRSLVSAAGLSVVGLGSYLVYRAATKDDSNPTFPEAGKGLATSRANSKGVPTRVLSDGAWTYGGKGVDTISQAAPILDIYFDYTCPHCAEFENLHSEEINQLLADGQITLALHPSRLLGQEWTDTVMNTMGLVLDEAPDQSMAFHTGAMDVLYQVMQTQNQSLMSVDSLVSAAQKAEVPTSVSDKFSSTVSSNTYKNWIDLADQAFKARGLNSTPTVYFAGQKIELQKLTTPTSLTELVASSGSGATGAPANGQ